MSFLPNRPLTSEDIINNVVKLKIRHFRGVFSRDSLPKKPLKIECAILNLDSFYGNGTHWVCYYRFKNKVIYFDSFGNLPPPIEVQKYFKGNNIIYNCSNFQKYNFYNCGHLCLEFLQRMNQ
uniref:Ubiquitin-like protease family profile domain-containing protein n=2 Tax=Sipha flava TaxID=143950 RepID=A0A2S2QSI0_9HEMI